MKVPVKPIVEFTRKNWKQISSVIGTVKVVNEYVKNRKEDRSKQGKVPYRKERYLYYKNEVLKSLEKKNRKDLFQYRLEVEQYIEQIKKEEAQDINVKKAIHSKRLKNWSSILIQIEDWIATKDYHEFVLIFNDSNFNSSYFDGYSALVNKFRGLMESGNLESLYEFISKITKKNIANIKEDFSI